MTTWPVSEAKARLNELARLAHSAHERFTFTRNGRERRAAVGRRS
ncbi:MAG: type II toxin-antitoxin system Phd/YefM family antitoxin [Actinomycetota bacterium]|nr:type II toxin-antitoxin system Phd/YefM family antitoxin [Actinomycetota bacterium]